MRTKLKWEELQRLNLLDLEDFEAGEILSKDSGAELVAMTIEHCREYLPKASGTNAPDFISGAGGYIQVKGMTGGFNLNGTLENTIIQDFSNFFFIITKPQKNGIHWYRIPKDNFIKLAKEYDIFRLSYNRYRLVEGLRKHDKRLREASDKSGRISPKEYKSKLTECIQLIDKLEKKNRIK